MSTDDNKLTEEEINYILDDRQWTRTSRIIRARVFLKRTKDMREKWFWRFVIALNTMD